MTAVVAAVNIEPPAAQQTTPARWCGQQGQPTGPAAQEGQVRAVARMVAEDRYCIDVLTQISAVTGAHREVALHLLDDHLRHCVLDAARDDPAAGTAKLDQLTPAMRRAPRP